MGSKDQALQRIEGRYQDILKNPNDQSHVRLLRKYSEQCDSIIEVGFRGGVSASVFLSSLPKKFTAIDWDRPPFEIDRELLKQMQEDCDDVGIQFQFIKADALTVEMPSCDLLFLDGFHTYEHVFLELIKHNASVSKLILLHDTDEPSCPGMFHAVEDFLLDNYHWWSLEARHRERPGLTVLRRTSSAGLARYPLVLIRTLEHAVARQKQMYYSQVAGIEPSTWDRYICEERLRYSDRERWPKANEAIGATEMMEAYLNQAHQKES
jgi:hypothetical protein